MVKYYCDRCGKETKNLVTTRIPIRKLSAGSLTCKTLELCNECNREADRIYDTLTDVKLNIFAKYLEQGGE